ncbi:MAG: YbjN domain-containing protein [Pseudomonadota bacterium]
MTRSRLAVPFTLCLALAACLDLGPGQGARPVQPVATPDGLIDATDPQPISEIAWRYGEAPWGRDSLGDPVINASFGELPYRVEFYGCSGGKECREIRFFSAFPPVGEERSAMPAKAIAEWNEDRRIGKASLGEEGQAVLEHNVVLQGGVTEQNLDAVFDAWGAALNEFAARTAN